MMRRIVPLICLISAVLVSGEQSKNPRSPQKHESIKQLSTRMLMQQIPVIYMHLSHKFDPSSKVFPRLSLRGGSSGIQHRPLTPRRKLRKTVDKSKGGTKSEEEEMHMQIGLNRVEVEALLSRMLVHEGSVVRDAQLDAEDEYEKPYFSDTLMTIMLDPDASMDLRQLAASILRQSLPSSWNLMSSNLRKTILALLSESLQSTESMAMALKRQIAMLVGVITPLVDSFQQVHTVFHQIMDMCRYFPLNFNLRVT
jgi:hypothetical protein